MKSISINELKKLTASEPQPDLIDVRTPAEFEAVHVPGARLLPLDTLDCAAVLSERDKTNNSSPIYILCHSGVRAKRAAEKFAAVGFDKGVVVEGGTQAWADAGLPVTRGERSVLPLDRQLQLTIGTMVVAGVLLSVFQNPAWVWLSAFAGCGLMFAGLSGICPMRSLIAKMPWNQGQKDAKKACCGV